MNSKVTDVIEKLKFPDSIRIRPGMYTDDIDTGNVLFRELVDNTVDLILKNQISLNIIARTNYKGYHYVIDNGYGLPLYQDKDYTNQPITIDLLSNPHVGSNFKRTTYSIGMNGVGSKLTNALSDHFLVIVNATKQLQSGHNYPEVITKGVGEGKTVFLIEFKKGILQEFKMINKEDILSHFENQEVPKMILSELPEDFGTMLVFRPDLEIIAKNKVEYHAYPFKLMKGLFNNDSLYSKLEINFKLNGEDVDPYKFENMYDHEDLMGNRSFGFSFDLPTKEKFPLKFLGNFGFHNSSMDHDSIGSVNLLRTHTGKHISVFQRALGKALSKYNAMIKVPDAKYGLRSFTLSFSVEPFFEGQTKNKLGNFKDKGYNENHTIEEFSNYLLKEVIEKNTEFFDGWCNKIIEYKRSLDRLSKRDFIMSHIEYASKDPTAALGMGSRVYDCTSKKLEDRELYLTEGKSAGSSLQRVRDISKHAVLP